jgi:hypothetical protein
MKLNSKAPMVRSPEADPHGIFLTSFISNNW